MKTKKMYNFFTPNSELSPNLQAIVEADKAMTATTELCNEWNYGKDRIGMIERFFAHLKGVKLTAHEYYYLEDCNHHTLAGWFATNETKEVAA